MHEVIVPDHREHVDVIVIVGRVIPGRRVIIALLPPEPVCEDLNAAYFASFLAIVLDDGVIIESSRHSPYPFLEAGPLVVGLQLGLEADMRAVGGRDGGEVLVVGVPLGRCCDERGSRGEPVDEDAAFREAALGGGDVWQKGYDGGCGRGGDGALGGDLWERHGCGVRAADGRGSNEVRLGEGLVRALCHVL